MFTVSQPQQANSVPRTNSEEDLSNLPGPPPTSTIHGKYVWALDFVQQPVRARMCGFGDKDRRPISPPPCLRLIIMDPETKQEIDPNSVDLQFFVLTVDLWDAAGMKEVNLVKHAQNSPSISTAQTTHYPPTLCEISPGPDPPAPYNVNDIPTYTQQNLVNPTNTQTPSSSQTYYGRDGNGVNGMNGMSRGNAFNGVNGMPGMNGMTDGHPSAMYPNRQQYAFPDGRYGAPTPYSNNYGSLPSFSSLPNSQQMPALTSPSYHAISQSALSGQQTAGMYTRNLIGSLSTSASALSDMHEQRGIWFILQDLSVRTEGWFRLKATFVDIGTASTAGPATLANGQQPAHELVGGTAPVLATVFSKPFQVFSAKKFPGVIESTDLSRKFARQGVKIPIRKDPGVKNTTRKHDGSDEEDLDDDQD